jgi:hypothetical protein
MRSLFFRRPLLFLFLAFASGHPAGAQSTDADRARLLRSQSTITAPESVTATGVDQGYAAASPNDSDLGEQAILKRVEKYEPFTIETGVPIYFTSNVALVDRGRVSDVIIAPLIGVTYAPRLQNTLYGEFGLRQQFFYYQDFGSFDFASFDALAGLVYFAPKLHNLVFRANLDYNRLTGTDTFDDFFSNVGLGLSAELPIPIGRAQQISLGADANISLYATPDPPQRSDFGVYAGYAVSITRSLSLNATGRLVVRPYETGGRTDLSEIIALSANYRIRDWLTLSAISTFVASQSNHSVFDYEVFNIGGGVTLSWKL